MLFLLVYNHCPVCVGPHMFGNFALHTLRSEVKLPWEDQVSPCTHIPYSGKLSREKTFTDWWKYDFRGENFSGLLAFAAPKDAMPPNFTEKTFANSHKTVKSAKVFSLESFPLYDRKILHLLLLHTFCLCYSNQILRSCPFVFTTLLGIYVYILNVWQSSTKIEPQALSHLFYCPTSSVVHNSSMH